MVTAFPIQSILDRPGESIGNVLPISAAGVTVIRPGVLRRDGAASDAYAGCFAGAADRTRRMSEPCRVPTGRAPRRVGPAALGATFDSQVQPAFGFPAPAQRPSRG